ncbi:hypothetical protein BKA66DRAFT_575614 [Pyrenochaeta sp. MPI-SDFR-AT-0127]|nr:hypothetical protein BKA66DRAFT_575614 [Pyrenochaeta sp. MPI-SDFR-AT-0127]
MTNPASTGSPDTKESTGYETHQSRKRKTGDVFEPSNTAQTRDTLEPGQTYDPSYEQFPDDPWYDLDYEDVTLKTSKLCDNLAVPLQRYAFVDQGIRDLLGATQAAKTLPSITKLFLAVLGEQGAGKSTLVNAILDRKLLERSGGTKSCTAYATIILHKDGADDSTQLSDIIVEFFNEDEIKISINEQILRWVEVYPGFYTGQQDNNEDESDAGRTPTEETTSENGPKNPNCPKMLSEQLKHSTQTAKEFFEIIFNTGKDTETRRWLQETLYETDISMGDFSNICFTHAQARLDQLDTKMPINNGKSTLSDVSDRELAKAEAMIREFWPFVKVVTVATGHVLLRHGLGFFDLPGYGDTSQLRETVINTFRRKADFEMVVVPSSRVQTSITQQQYIDLSIHLHKGPNKTLLVMNKSDDLINADNMEAQIRHIEQEPFPTFMARFEKIEMLKADSSIHPSTIAALRTELVKDVSAEIITHETEIVQKQMREKNIEVYSTSALAYTEWTDPYRTKEPLIGPRTSGIPALRQLLCKLPTKANFQNYYDHTFRVLPRLRSQADRVTEKHIEDQSYAMMRQDLKQKIPGNIENLKRVTINQIDSLIMKPWSSTEKQKVITAITRLPDHKWIHCKIHHSGFRKMLRENGIPVNGKYYGYNLNRDILSTIVGYIDKWHTVMHHQAEQLSNSLKQPVQFFLAETEASINRSSADPTLKERVIEALEDTLEAMELAYDTLLAGLLQSLKETHLHYTTEIDIYSPIAQKMKAIYARAQDRRNVQFGKGTYERQRKTIVTFIIDPRRATHSHPCIGKLSPLLKILRNGIVSEQRHAWKKNCDDFITDVAVQLNDFCKITEDLLKNTAYKTQEHKKARELVKKLLVDFDKTLTEIQCRFTGMELQPLKKKVRRNGFERRSNPHDQAVALIAPNSVVSTSTAMVPMSYRPNWLQYPESFDPEPTSPEE